MHASVIRKTGEQNYLSMTYGVSLLYSWLFSLKVLLEYIISMPVKYAFFRHLFKKSTFKFSLFLKKWFSNRKIEITPAKLKLSLIFLHISMRANFTFT